MHAWMHAHARTHTGGIALSIAHLHGNAIIWLWGVMLEWLTMRLTTSLSKHKEKLGRMEYIVCCFFSSGFRIYTLKLEDVCHPALSLVTHELIHCLYSWSNTLFQPFFFFFFFSLRLAQSLSSHSRNTGSLFSCPSLHPSFSFPH